MSPRTAVREAHRVREKRVGTRASGNPRARAPPARARGIAAHRGQRSPARMRRNVIGVAAAAAFLSAPLVEGQRGTDEDTSAEP